MCKRRAALVVLRIAPNFEWSGRLGLRDHQDLSYYTAIQDYLTDRASSRARSTCDGSIRRETERQEIWPQANKLESPVIYSRYHSAHVTADTDLRRAAATASARTPHYRQRTTGRRAADRGRHRP